MVCKKLAQRHQTTMQSSNMYLAAFQHTIYDNHVFVLLFLQSNSYYFTFTGGVPIEKFLNRSNIKRYTESEHRYRPNIIKCSYTFRLEETEKL